MSTKPFWDFESVVGLYGYKRGVAGVTRPGASLGLQWLGKNSNKINALAHLWVHNPTS
jgi:hypothetical protein